MELITTSRVGRILDKPESTIRKMADDGRLPVAVTLESGTRLFDRHVIEQRKAVDHAAV
jgi:hypothetical protein